MINDGTETPTRATNIAALSHTVPRLTAATIPEQQADHKRKAQRTKPQLQRYWKSLSNGGRNWALSLREKILNLLEIPCPYK